MYLISVKTELFTREIGKPVHDNFPNCKFLGGYTFKSIYLMNAYNK